MSGNRENGSRITEVTRGCRTDLCLSVSNRVDHPLLHGVASRSKKEVKVQIWLLLCNLSCSVSIYWFVSCLIFCSFSTRVFLTSQLCQTLCTKLLLQYLFNGHMLWSTLFAYINWDCLLPFWALPTLCSAVVTSSWSVVRRPHYLQGFAALLCIGIFAYLVFN